MSFHTYILQSATTGKLYIGQTNNLEDRLVRHNTNRNKYTAGKGPWLLYFSKCFETRAEAVQLEQQLKNWKNPAKVKQWVAEQMNG
ncbi:MAG: GIY-YIG nuclease family protein [Chitinophagales bacterium]|nr:GIY-YIG nuclease family protein [Chitinophagales bacterium]